jgi:hypothetical protein
MLALEWSVEEWYADVRADEWLAYVMDDVLELLADMVRKGVRADGRGKIPRLVPHGQAAKRAGRKGGRGMRTGYFPDHLTRSAIRGRTDRATCSIKPPWNLAHWVNTELFKRGIDFLVAGPAVVARVMETSGQWLEAAADSGKGTFDTAALRQAREERARKPRRRRAKRRRSKAARRQAAAQQRAHSKWRK